VDYISIQNEPDYEADWNCCLFAPTETDELAGYDKALEAVYEKLQQEMADPPLLVGPETIGIGYLEFYKYLEEINTDHIYAIAHHLYRGGEHSRPDSFNYSLRQLNEKYPDKPKFQTEFERGENGFNTAWLIHNSLVEGNINAYLYWDLIWNNGGLVFLENAYFKTQWRTEKGYYKTDEYYALQHYSKFIGEGYTRVEISGTNNKLKLSAFISPAEDELVIVGLNTLLVEKDIKLNIPGFTYSSSEVYSSVFPGEEKRFHDEGPLSADNTISIPAYSVVTVRLID
ncbi:MAG TPA: hypothetical protein VKY40_09090, partial [Halanaerobiales bacterium]|nr:hypothetical protein [Halanaerobiales bacterium]